MVNVVISAAISTSRMTDSAAVAVLDGRAQRRRGVAEPVLRGADAASICVQVADRAVYRGQERLRFCGRVEFIRNQASIQRSRLHAREQNADPIVAGVFRADLEVGSSTTYPR